MTKYRWWARLVWFAITHPHTLIRSIVLAARHPGAADRELAEVLEKVPVAAKQEVLDAFPWARGPR